jgi:hypothetical protein
MLAARRPWHHHPGIEAGSPKIDEGGEMDVLLQARTKHGVQLIWFRYPPLPARQAIT